MADKHPRAPRREPAPESGEKVVQTFRLPVSLIAYLRKQAEDRGYDLTRFVNTVLDGFQTYHGLPRMAAQLLEQDREALKMDKLDYFLHVFHERSKVVEAKKPGFDLAADAETPKSKR
jgi:hypothetical protein